jgi:hypothetical protein
MLARASENILLAFSVQLVLSGGGRRCHAKREEAARISVTLLFRGFGAVPCSGATLQAITKTFFLCRGPTI